MCISWHTHNDQYAISLHLLQLYPAITWTINSLIQHRCALTVKNNIMLSCVYIFTFWKVLTAPTYFGLSVILKHPPLPMAHI